MSPKRGSFPQPKPGGKPTVIPKPPTAPTPTSITAGGSMRSKKPSLKYK